MGWNYGVVQLRNAYAELQFTVKKGLNSFAQLNLP